MTHMFYQETELLLCVLKLYEKSYDLIANLTSAVTLKLKYSIRNDNGLHFTKPSQKYMLIMSISILNDE